MLAVFPDRSEEWDFPGTITSGTMTGTMTLAESDFPSDFPDDGTIASGTKTSPPEGLTLI